MVHAPIEIEIGKGIVGYVARSGVAEIIPDTTLDSRYIVDDEKRYSEITVPLVSDGKWSVSLTVSIPKELFHEEPSKDIVSDRGIIMPTSFSGQKQKGKPESKNGSVAQQAESSWIQAAGPAFADEPHFFFSMPEFCAADDTCQRGSL